MKPEKDKDNIHVNLQGHSLLKVISRTVSLPSKLFLFVGLALFLYGLTIVYGAYQSSSWLPVNGTITVSSMRVDTSTSTTGTGGSYRSTTSTSYAPEISYEYSLMGVKYSNSGIILGGNIGTGSSARASRLINKYPVGAAVTVYYNPRDPYQSVLERGLHLENFFIAGFGLAFIIFSMLWRHSVGKFTSMLQFGGAKTGKKPHKFSNSTMSKAAAATKTEAQEPALVGKWKVTKQLPPQIELTKLMMKQWGMPDMDGAVYPDMGETFVVITASTILFASEGMGGFGGQSLSYRVVQDTMQLEELETNLLTKKMQPFFPSFYYYHFSGQELVLKSNPISGFDNRSVTYFLSRA